MGAEEAGSAGDHAGAHLRPAGYATDRARRAGGAQAGAAFRRACPAGRALQRRGVDRAWRRRRPSSAEGGASGRWPCSAVARAAFRRTARRFSLCADDAEDAFQRAVEILLTKAPERPPQRARRLDAGRHPARGAGRAPRARAHPRGVARRRERALRAARVRAAGPAERAERRERVAAAARALAELKPDERRAIVLQAQGYSYAEIASSAAGPTPRSTAAWPRAGRGFARSLPLLDTLERLAQHEGEAPRAEEPVQGIADPSPTGRAKPSVEDHLHGAAALARARPQLEGRARQQRVGVSHVARTTPGSDHS